VGAQYQISDPWLLNFGLAYDSDFQDGSDVSPLLPLNSAWRFGVGAQHQPSENFFWGVAVEHEAGHPRWSRRSHRLVRLCRNDISRPVRQLEVLMLIINITKMQCGDNACYVVLGKHVLKH
jgi:hypothetical protein